MMCLAGRERCLLARESNDIVSAAIRPRRPNPTRGSSSLATEDEIAGDAGRDSPLCVWHPFRTSSSSMRVLSTVGPLLLLSAMLAIVASVYVLLGEEPPQSVLTLSSTVQSLFILYWVVVDARRRRRVPCHDFGFLVGIYLPVSLIWYLVWSRGLRGLLLLGGFVVLVALPQICAVLVGILK